MDILLEETVCAERSAPVLLIVSKIGAIETRSAFEILPPILTRDDLHASKRLPQFYCIPIYYHTMNRFSFESKPLPNAHTCSDI